MSYFAMKTIEESITDSSASAQPRNDTFGYYQANNPKQDSSSYRDNSSEDLIIASSSPRKATLDPVVVSPGYQKQLGQNYESVH